MDGMATHQLTSGTPEPSPGTRRGRCCSSPPRPLSPSGPAGSALASSADSARSTCCPASRRRLSTWTPRSRCRSAFSSSVRTPCSRGSASGAPATGPGTWPAESAIGALVLGCLGQVAYHLLAAAHWAEAPWLVVVGVACLPVVTLYFAATLTHLILADRRDAEEAKSAAEQAAADAERARAERAAARAELAAQRQARKGGTGTRKRNRNGTGTSKAAVPEPAFEAEPEPAAEEVVDIDAEARILKAMAAGELDTEAAILQLVAAGRTPSRAGKLAGRSDSYGRKVVRTARDLAATAPKGQDPQT